LSILLKIISHFYVGLCRHSLTANGSRLGDVADF